MIKKKLLRCLFIFGVSQPVEHTLKDINQKQSADFSLLDFVSNGHHGTKKLIKKVFGVSGSSANLLIVVLMVFLIIWLIFNIILKNYRKYFSNPV